MAFVDFQKRNKVTLGLASASVATTTTTGSWWSMAKAHHVAVLFVIGAWSAAATVNILQATDSSGSGAKAIGAGKTLALTAGHANTIQILEVEASELDVANAFNHIAVQAVAAGAGAVLGATVVRVPIRFMPSSLIT